ncbi:uncharacterized protein DUF2621 [Planomicrobium soli]|uniref:Uncharacterized protein DUF2621 n=1 Tax=Planomicrobium soli TaxID=1176648 RepID=A0A2P8H4G2_9BACL|nr:DUF2621 domain-containing protein [Planomicrobium soli]PSL41089.1 uncharacterized protein DUF2621 [Planomicrobium soli]
MQLDGWFLWFILFWVVALVGSFAIGGYFMFRKFLKSMPKKDGLSDLNWEEYYVDKTIHLWGDEQKALLNELVQPVPDLFRPVAKQKIAGKIGQIVLKEKAKNLQHEHIIRGYIQATPKRDHKFLRKKLNELQIDVAPYEHYFEK